MYHDPNAGMPPPEPAAGYAYGVAPAATRPGAFGRGIRHAWISEGPGISGGFTLIRS